METIDIFDVLRRHTLLIVSLCVLTTLAGYGVSFLSPLVPEKYEASAVVLVRPHEQIKIEPNSSGKEFSDYPVAQTPDGHAVGFGELRVLEGDAAQGAEENVGEPQPQLIGAHGRGRGAVGEGIKLAFLDPVLHVATCNNVSRRGTARQPRRA